MGLTMIKMKIFTDYTLKKGENYYLQGYLKEVIRYIIRDQEIMV